MNSNISDEFLKLAKENGKIRNIKETFQEYPVEKEWYIHMMREAFYRDLK